MQLTVAEAQLLRDAQRHAGAFSLLSDALDKQPQQPDFSTTSLTAEKLERFDLLGKHLRELINVKPDHARLQCARLLVCRSQHALPEARKLIEKALEIAPEDYFIIDSLGWVLYREGDLKGAARELRRAYSGGPTPRSARISAKSCGSWASATRRAASGTKRSRPVPRTKLC